VGADGIPALVPVQVPQEYSCLTSESSALDSSFGSVDTLI
jgi:hypothetical protein